MPLLRDLKGLWDSQRTLLLCTGSLLLGCTLGLVIVELRFISVCMHTVRLVPKSKDGTIPEATERERKDVEDYCADEAAWIFHGAPPSGRWTYNWFWELKETDDAKPTAPP